MPSSAASSDGGQGVLASEAYSLVYVHVQAFRSFAAAELVGPFHDATTAVVGANGSGKSTLVDAVRYALGESVSSRMDAGTTARAQRLLETATSRPGGHSSREKSGPTSQIADCNLPDSDEDEISPEFTAAVTLHFRHRTSSERFAVHRAGSRYRAGLLASDPEPGDVVDAARCLRRVTRASMRQLLGARVNLHAERLDSIVIRQNAAMGVLLSCSRVGLREYVERMLGNSDLIKSVQATEARIATQAGTLHALEDEAARLASERDGLQDAVDAVHAFRLQRTALDRSWREYLQRHAFLLDARIEDARATAEIALREASKAADAWADAKQAADALAGKQAALGAAADAAAAAAAGSKRDVAGARKRLRALLKRVRAAETAVAREAETATALDERHRSLTTDRSRLADERASNANRRAAATVELAAAEAELARRKCEATADEQALMRHVEAHGDLRGQEADAPAMDVFIDARKDPLEQMQMLLASDATALASLEARTAERAALVASLDARLDAAEDGRAVDSRQQEALHTRVKSLQSGMARLKARVHDAPVAPDAVLGLVPDLVRVDDARFVLAANAVLLSIVRSTVLVRDRRAALQLVQHWRTSRFGRIRCEIADDLAPVARPGPAHPTLATRLDSVLSARDDATVVARFLDKHAACWFVAETLAAAVTAHDACAANIVTLDGSMILASGEMRRNDGVSWELLDAGLGSVLLSADEARSANDRMAELEQARRQAVGEMERMRTDATRIQRNMDMLENKIARAHARQEQRSTLAAERARKTAQQREACAEQTRLFAIAASPDAVALPDLVLRVAALSDAQQEWDVAIAVFDRQLASIDTALAKLGQQRTALRQSQARPSADTDMDDEIAAAKADAERAGAAHEALAKKAASARTRAAVADEKLASARQRMDVLWDEEAMAKRRRRAAQATAASLAVERGKVSEEADKRAVSMQGDMDDWDPDMPDVGDLDEAMRSVADERTRLQVSERMLARQAADVDEAVLAEHAALSERVAAIEARAGDERAQVAQLHKKRRALEDERFATLASQLPRINATFGDLFRRLSGCSTADAILRGSDDQALLAQDGLILHVRTRTAEWLDVARLSGGQQAIVALSLAMSFHALQAWPLCVLDEFDAALDTSAVRRASDVVAAMAADAGVQCIAVSHRPEFYLATASAVGIYKAQGTSRSVSSARA